MGRIKVSLRTSQCHSLTGESQVSPLSAVTAYPLEQQHREDHLLKRELVAWCGGQGIEADAG